MGPEGIILVNPPITTFQQSLTHSAMYNSSTISGTKNPHKALDKEANWTYEVSQ